jgi:hypothetical protein
VNTIVKTAALLGTVLVLAATASLRAEPPSVDALIQRLGSNEFAEREEATRALDALGPAALDALKKAAHSPDLEVRQRASTLVRRIEKRLDAARLLAPRTLRLNVKDAPLDEVVSELRRKSGFEVVLDPQVKAPNRKVTLDTGELPFWVVLEKLCAAAELVETVPPPPTEPPNRVVRGSSVVIIGGGMRAIATDIMKPDPPEKDEVVTLTDGKPKPLPGHLAGALRITALPPDAASIPEVAAQPAEHLLILETSLEPRLKWLQALSIRVSRAIDDQGQSLTGKLTFLGKPAAPRGRASVFINGQPVYPDDPGPSGQVARLVPVRLQRGEKPAKMLTELNGTLVALVQSAPEVLVSVDNPQKAVGQQVSNGEAGLKVLEMTKSDDGLYTVRFLVESPPRGVEDGTAGATNGFVMINGRVVNGTNDEPLSAQNFALLDDKGKPLEVVRATNTGKRAGSARELELAFRPAEGQGEPARLVYTGRRTSIIEVPFTLKNVPLP